MSASVQRLASLLGGIRWELRSARVHSSDIYSFWRLAADVLLFRVLRVLPVLAHVGRVRQVRLDGAVISYRLNRGDLQSIREVWFEETYRVPFGELPSSVLDLGANIGLASIWLARQYDCEVIAVEPEPANADLARRNYALNGVRGAVVEAAIGPRDETLPFAIDRASNLGSLRAAAEGRAVVDVVVRTPQSVMQEFGLDSIDLCKLDIEGGEQALLLEGDATWLRSVRGVLAELHHGLIDGPKVVAAVEAQGLRFHPAGVDGLKTDYFVASTNPPGPAA